MSCLHRCVTRFDSNAYALWALDYVNIGQDSYGLKGQKPIVQGHYTATTLTSNGGA